MDEPPPSPPLTATEQAFKACRMGDLTRVQELATTDPTLLSATDELGSFTLLHWAAAQGHVKLAEWLLEAGSQVGALNKLRETPLHIAAMKGHCDVAHVLLTNEADVNALSGSPPPAREVGDALSEMPHYFSPCPQTPLDVARAFYQYEIAKLLEAHGGTTCPTEVLLAHPNYVQADPERVLIGAITMQAADFIPDLATKTNINMRLDAAGNTPLHIAIVPGEETAHTVQTLLDAGADPNRRNRRWQRPLDVARKLDLTDLIELLEPVTRKSLWDRFRAHMREALNLDV